MTAIVNNLILTSGHGKRDNTTPQIHLTGTLRITQLPNDITEETVRDAFSSVSYLLLLFFLFNHMYLNDILSMDKYLKSSYLVMVELWLNIVRMK
jgi:RNA recognition motif-containing protein